MDGQHLGCAKCSGVRLYDANITGSHLYRYSVKQRFISWFPIWVSHCAEHHCTPASSSTQPRPRAGPPRGSGQLCPRWWSLRTAQVSRRVYCLYYKSVSWGLGQTFAGTSMDSDRWWLLLCWSHRWEWPSLLGTRPVRAPEWPQPENWTLKWKQTHVRNEE